MPFFSISEIKQQLKSAGIFLAKNRGQCYLIDKNILKIIDKAAKITKNDVVLEIGAGIGSLSDILIERAKQVILIENDKKVIDFLTQSYKDKFALELHEIGFLQRNLPEKPNVFLIFGDALEADFHAANKICANIPYQISAPLIFKIIAEWSFDDVILMVQKEFADRLRAKKDNSKYSRLSAAAGLFLDVHLIHEVSRKSFFPEPQVDSMIIQLLPTKFFKTHKEQLDEDRIHYLDFLEGIFPFKNKSLKNGLKYYFQNRKPNYLALNFEEITKHSILSPKLSTKVHFFSSFELYQFLYLMKYGIQCPLEWE